MSDEEPVNPKPELEEACKPRCIKALLEYQVSSKLGSVRAFNPNTLTSNIIQWIKNRDCLTLCRPVRSGLKVMRRARPTAQDR